MAMLVFALAAGGCDKDKTDTATSNARAPSASNASKSAPVSSEDKEKAPVDNGKDGKENVELAEAYAKDVCECKNAQCINKAGERYHEATNKMYEDKQIRTPTPEQKKMMDEASTRVSECTDKLLKRK